MFKFNNEELAQKELIASAIMKKRIGDELEVSFRGKLAGTQQRYAHLLVPSRHESRRYVSLDWLAWTGFELKAKAVDEPRANGTVVWTDGQTFVKDRSGWVDISCQSNLVPYGKDIRYRSWFELVTTGIPWRVVYDPSATENQPS